MRRKIRIFLYWFTKDKRQLDEYMKLFRRGHKFSESEIVRLKELIDHENNVYER